MNIRKCHKIVASLHSAHTFIRTNISSRQKEIWQIVNMSDLSKTRMNLAAIKKVDPYAKDIVDSSSHVAFYTFNATSNEWEKTDVEGVFFIYSRNAQPFHSIFINNRLNTNSFVEPITNQLELQSQPPFLLYRNERSRIRGFWFYNSEECGRIGNLVSSLIQDIGCREGLLSANENNKKDNVNIFKMLTKAQKEYNTSVNNMQQSTAPPRNVLNFFAAAKPSASEPAQIKKLLPNTLSVEQLEKQHRVQTPDAIQTVNQTPILFTPTSQYKTNNSERFSTPIRTSGMDFSVGQFPVSNSANVTLNSNEDRLRKLLICEPTALKSSDHEKLKPALIPPTMYEKLPLKTPGEDYDNTMLLNQSQFVQAFTHLIQTDEDFVQKLYNSYLKVVTKTIAS